MLERPRRSIFAYFFGFLRGTRFSKKRGGGSPHGGGVRGGGAPPSVLFRADLPANSLPELGTNYVETVMSSGSFGRGYSRFSESDGDLEPRQAENWVVVQVEDALQLISVCVFAPL